MREAEDGSSLNLAAISRRAERAVGGRLLGASRHRVASRRASRSACRWRASAAEPTRPVRSDSGRTTGGNASPARGVRRPADELAAAVRVHAAARIAPARSRPTRAGARSSSRCLRSTWCIDRSSTVRPLLAPAIRPDDPHARLLCRLAETDEHARIVGRRVAAVGSSAPPQRRARRPHHRDARAEHVATSVSRSTSRSPSQ